MTRFVTEPTPNPNSLKILRDSGSFITGGLEAFSSAAEASGHPIAERLFKIQGVTNVFIVPQFLTISKAPTAEWRAVWPAVEAALKEIFD